MLIIGRKSVDWQQSQFHHKYHKQAQNKNP